MSKKEEFIRNNSLEGSNAAGGDEMAYILQIESFLYKLSYAERAGNRLLASYSVDQHRQAVTELEFFAQEGG